MQTPLCKFGYTSYSHSDSASLYLKVQMKLSFELLVQIVQETPRILLLPEHIVISCTTPSPTQKVEAMSLLLRTTCT